MVIDIFFYAEVYQGPLQRSKMQSFARMVNGSQPFTIDAKVSILDVQRDPDYTSDAYRHVIRCVIWYNLVRFFCLIRFFGIILLVLTQNFPENLDFFMYVCVSKGKKCKFFLENFACLLNELTLCLTSVFVYVASTDIFNAPPKPVTEVVKKIIQFVEINLSLLFSYLLLMMKVFILGCRGYPYSLTETFILFQFQNKVAVYYLY